jgi:hypothetical protein
VRAARDFDEFYRSRLREPEDTTQLLVLSFDAKGIATIHRDLREATRKKAGSSRRRLSSHQAVQPPSTRSSCPVT